MILLSGLTELKSWLPNIQVSTVKYTIHVVMWTAANKSLLPCSFVLFSFYSFLTCQRNVGCIQGGKVFFPLRNALRLKSSSPSVVLCHSVTWLSSLHFFQCTHHPATEIQVHPQLRTEEEECSHWFIERPCGVWHIHPPTGGKGSQGLKQ